MVEQGDKKQGDERVKYFREIGLLLPEGESVPPPMGRLRERRPSNWFEEENDRLLEAEVRFRMDYTAGDDD